MLFGVRVRRVEQRAETRRRGRGAINSINGRGRRDRQTDRQTVDTYYRAH